MQQHEFTAFPRATEGRGASRRLRRSGRAPGIVYGGTAQPQPVELDHNALIHALKREAFHSSILTMKFEGVVQRVLLRDVQMHPFRNEVLHVDFQRVDENRRIHIKVPLHFTHAEDSPAHKTTDAIISHVLTELDVSCLPKDLPAFIEVDLSTLAVGQSIHVSDLKLPQGVAAVTRGKVRPGCRDGDHSACRRRGRGSRGHDRRRRHRGRCRGRGSEARRQGRREAWRQGRRQGRGQG